jgi:hypothetical protein
LVRIFETENGTERKALRSIPVNNHVEILVDGKAGMETNDDDTVPLLNNWVFKSYTVQRRIWRPLLLF